MVLTSFEPIRAFVTVLCIRHLFSLAEEYIFSSKQYVSIFETYHFTRAVAMEEIGSTSTVPSTLTAVISAVNEEDKCLECFVTYGGFCVIYSGQIDKLIGWCQRHGLLLKEKKSVMVRHYFFWVCTYLNKGGGCRGKAPT